MNSSGSNDASAAGAAVACAPGISLSEVLSALSFALDITEGQPEGHALRSCLIGMRLAEQTGLPAAQRNSLYYALMLKDLGCSTNASQVCSLFGADDRMVKQGLKTTDWTRLPESFRFVSRHAMQNGSLLARIRRMVSLSLAGQRGSREMFKARCERGSSIARMLELPAETADAIRTLDEHWDGKGQPAGLRREQIPLAGRILCLSQTVEVFITAGSVAGACEMARGRSGTWFDPELVERLCEIERDERFWQRLQSGDLQAEVAAIDPGDRTLSAGQEQLERVARAFATVVDAKSPWTYRHSEGVAEIAVGVGQVLGMRAHELHQLKLAALLHDIGKLGVSNLILDKPGRLTPDEHAQMRRHVEHTYRILHRVTSLREVAEIAGSHHEKLDGTGYWRGLTSASLPVSARVLVVADICEALMADRPYRKSLPRRQVMEIMKSEVGAGVCPDALDALKQFLRKSNYTPRRAQASEQA